MNVNPISNNQQSFKARLYFKNAICIPGFNVGNLTGFNVRNVLLKGTTIINTEEVSDSFMHAIESANQPTIKDAYQKKSDLYQQMAELVADTKEENEKAFKHTLITTTNGAYCVKIPAEKVCLLKHMADKFGDYEKDAHTYEHISYISSEDRLPNYFVSSLESMDGDMKKEIHFPEYAL